jgi:hypothetical protein
MAEQVMDTWAHIAALLNLETWDQDSVEAEISRLQQADAAALDLDFSGLRQGWD